jgi:D-aminopeptidase
MKRVIILILILLIAEQPSGAQERKRIRDCGIHPGTLETGAWNAITDVTGVEVGHSTLISGESVRTGVTVIKPHDGNLFRQKVPAAVSVGNGFGKAIGFTQVQELGNLETPVVLTSTLNVFSVADALVEYMLSLPENGEVRSVNPVVGETNDGWLNDIRSRPVKKEHLFHALSAASSGPVAEGNVGAGTGTRCLGYKGGIGTSSRVLHGKGGGYTVGVLVQTNFGGTLTICGVPVGRELNNLPREKRDPGEDGGSCMIVVATDAPLSDRNLERLAKRSFLALGRVGSYMSNGSGDYAIAFSTHPGCRISHQADRVQDIPSLGNDYLDALFLAALEATEEAIYNSLFMAEDMVGYRGRNTESLPIGRTLRILESPGVERALE